MNIKKLIAVTLSAATFALSLTARGGKSSDSSACLLYTSPSPRD